MSKRIVQILTVAVLMYAMTVMSEASLVIRGTDDLGNKLIYDEALDITWYDYSNAQDDWASQVAWGVNLSVTYNSMIYDDWRLPTAGTTPVSGYNQSGPDNEMEHLYYDEGSGGIPTEFSNIVSSYYWSGTTYASNPGYAGTFTFAVGFQNNSIKGNDYYALAVRPGDVYPFQYLRSGMEYFSLNYSDAQLTQLADFYFDGKDGGEPENITIDDTEWQYYAGNLPGDTDGLVYDIGDSWEYMGKKFIKLGSGIGEPLGGAVPELPAGSVGIVLTGLLGVLHRKRR